MYVIGIDGGGSKTIAVLADKHGTVIAKETVGPTNPNSVGKEEASIRMAGLLSSIKGKHPLQYNQVAALFAGIAGASSPVNKKNLTEAFQPILPRNCLLTVDHDAVIALYSGTFGHPGAVHISGTGSISYGIDDEWDSHRVGGWGYLIGDEGSGYSIGKAGLHAALQAHDSITTGTSLLEKIKQHFQVAHLPEVIPLVYTQEARQTIAQLAKIVIEAVDENDPVAHKIIQTEANKLSIQLAALVNKMTINTNRLLPVILTGGVMQRADLFEAAIRCYMKQHVTTPVQVTKVALPPVAGAVIGAFKHAHISFHEKSFADRFNQSF